MCVYLFLFPGYVYSTIIVSFLMLVYYQNVNRIRSKTHELLLSVLNCDYDIICLTETNLNGAVFDSEIFDSRYNVLRRDRYESNMRKTEGGGVLIALKKHINFIRQASWDSDVEDLWISVLPTGKNVQTINICVCYLPPDLNFKCLLKFYDNCQNIITRSSELDEFLCIGDFNTPDITWTKSIDSNAMTPIHSHGQKADLLLETIHLCNFNQYNNIPNQNNRFLDLILFTSSSIQVYGATPLSRLDNHHPALVADLDDLKTKDKSFKPKKQKRLNFNKSNFDMINHDLSEINWPNVLKELDNVDDLTDTFYRKLNDIISKHTPLVKNNNTDYPVWFSPALKRTLNEKLKYHRRFRHFENPLDYDTYSMLRRRCQKLIDTDYASFTSSVESSLNNNIKHFWKYVNSRKSSSSLPQTMKYGDLVSSDRKSICELFSNYFSSVFEQTSSSLVTNFIKPVHEPNRFINAMKISHNDIINKIARLDPNKGAGPDGIPALLIKKCAKTLSIPLGIIFNISLQSGVFPSEWKTAHVVPIFKSGDKSRCENYRPISILSCLGKLFESLVYDTLYYHIKPFLSPRQHGFVSNRSTTSNLLEYKNYICHAFAKTSQVDSVYTDFSKAFDKVNHYILCKKLASYGIHGNLLRWIESYLTKRSQLVAVRGFVSLPANVTSGVPQGSHLGPLFFVAFINDLISELTCPCLLYADDLKVFRTIDNLADTVSLQSDIETIDKWCYDNHMFLNVKKCFVISFTNKHNIVFGDYTLKGETLERKAVAKDLGVLFDEKLTFRDHYDTIISRSNQLIGFLSRSTTRFKNPDSFLYLYSTLVRTILEYNSTIWSPYYAVHSDRIERVQKKCLNILCYRYGLKRKLSSYNEKLLKFNLLPLQTRRKYYDFTIFFKIIHSLVDSPSLLALVNFNIKPRSRQPHLKPFALQVYTNNTSFYNPMVRMCRQYNELLSQNHNKVDIFNQNLCKFKKDVLAILSSEWMPGHSSV